MNKNLKIDISIEGKTTIAKFTGEFDKAGFSDVRGELLGLVSGFKGERLVFDFGRVRFINSEGIGFLMEAYSNLKDNGKQLVIVGANAHVMDVFQTIGLPDLVPLYKSMKDLTDL